MAGAAVIVAVTNAMARPRLSLRVRRRRRELRGAGRAPRPLARQALAETATWVKEDLDLTLADRHGAGRRHSRAGPRRPRRPLRAVGEHLDRDVLRRRHGLGRCRHEAWRDRRPAGAARRASRSVRPVLPLRGNPGLARAGAVAGGGAGAERAAPRAFRAAIEQIARIVEKTPDASRPVPGQRLRLTWPPAGADLEARASRRAGESIWQRKIKVLALDAVCVPRHALQHHGRQLHSGEIHPRAGRQFRLPEVRRFAPHGARLHAGAGRRDRAASRRPAPQRASCATARTASRPR